MTKMQISRNGRTFQFRYKVSSKETFDQSEYELLKNDSTGSFLVPDYKHSFFGSSFNATIENSSILSEKLSGGIGSEEFLDIFLQILQCLKKAEQLYIKREMLLCDKDYIFVMNSTGSVSIIYLPVKIDYEAGSLSSFLLKIIDITVLNDGAAVKLRILRDFLVNMEKIDLDQAIQRVNKLSGNTVKDDETVEMADPDHFDDEEEPEEDDGTVLLKEKKKPAEVRVVGTFTAVNSSDYFEIDSRSLMVGRSRKVDHIIGNDAVSGVHAEIIKEDTGFYVTDHYSSNGTKINGKAIEPGNKERLLNGAKVSFADEEYIFHIKQVS